MPSLERFFNPQMRALSLNLQSLPGARLYFFAAGSSTPKPTYTTKSGGTAHPNPVPADPNGVFPPIFIDGLYRVELRSKQNIVQPGWPIDNVGQDIPIVPYAPWSELVTYAEFERVTDSLTGIVYRSKIDGNLGNIPASSPSDWEVVIDPVPSSFTSDAPWISWSDDGGQISLDVDIEGLSDDVIENIDTIGNSLTIEGDLDITGDATVGDTLEVSSDATVGGALGVTGAISGASASVASGVALGNTTQAGATILDWYQEGTFTPVVSGSGSAGTCTYSTQLGNFTRIGNVVYYCIRLSWTSHTGTGTIVIGGLPYVSAIGNFAAGYGAYDSLLVGSGLQLTPKIDLTGISYITLWSSNPAGGAEAVIAMDANVNQLSISGFYFV